MSNQNTNNINANDDTQSEVEEAISNNAIQCCTCFRTFHTQAQFGQHSRICRGGASVARRFINISSQPYKYCFLERQNKDKLEIKSRFIVKICNVSINWKDIAKKNGLHDSAIAQLLKSKELGNVHCSVRHRKESGLIVANFVIRSVQQTPDCIHSAKIRIEEAVDEVKNKLPEEVHMHMHLCQVNKCRELVIRDTEGYCSRHRAQKYHKKNAKKRKNNANANANHKSNKNNAKKMNHSNTTTDNNGNINNHMNYMMNHNHNNHYINQMQQLQQLQQLQQIQQQQQQQQHMANASPHLQSVTFMHHAQQVMASGKRSNSLGCYDDVDAPLSIRDRQHGLRLQRSLPCPDQLHIPSCAAHTSFDPVPRTQSVPAKGFGSTPF
eukprot:231932_1